MAKHSCSLAFTPTLWWIVAVSWTSCYVGRTTVRHVRDSTPMPRGLYALSHLRLWVHKGVVEGYIVRAIIKNPQNKRTCYSLTYRALTWYTFIILITAYKKIGRHNYSREAHKYPQSILHCIRLGLPWPSVVIDEEINPATAFPTPFGLYDNHVVPMVFYNAPATFQSVINSMFADHIQSGYCLGCLDHITMYGSCT